MNGLLKRLSDETCLIADGAWGTLLQKAGLGVGACPEEWNLLHPDKVKSVADAYLAAGSEILKTNTFGANRFRLQHYQLGKESYNLARLGAEISRSSALDMALVAGSVGPTGLIPGIDDVTDAELEEAYSEQISGLIAGGVDALLLETFYSIEELQLALSAAKKLTKLPVICSATYGKTDDGSFRTMTGLFPGEFLTAALSSGADIVGANCGFGIADTIEVMQAYREASPTAKLSCMANAGMPQIEGHAIVYPETPDYFVTFTGQLQALQISIVGGCCGTTPEHIRKLKEILKP